MVPMEVLILMFKTSSLEILIIEQRLEKPMVPVEAMPIFSSV